jgi:hypothetical protein
MSFFDPKSQTSTFQSLKVFRILPMNHIFVCFNFLKTNWVNDMSPTQFNKKKKKRNMGQHLTHSSLGVYDLFLKSFFSFFLNFNYNFIEIK